MSEKELIEKLNQLEQQIKQRDCQQRVLRFALESVSEVIRSNHTQDIKDTVPFIKTILKITADKVDD